MENKQNSKLTNPITIKLIGRRIFVLRQAKKISREKLAFKIGISHQQLYKYEMGQSRITVDRLLDIAKALDIKPKDFLPNKRIGTGTDTSKLFDNFGNNRKEYRIITQYSKLKKLSVDELVLRFLELIIKS